jgi:hypothetical protein
LLRLFDLYIKYLVMKVQKNQFRISDFDPRAVFRNVMTMIHWRISTGTKKHLEKLESMINVGMQWMIGKLIRKPKGSIRISVCEAWSVSPAIG